MTTKHAIIFGLIGGAIAGYFFADKLVAYPPFKQVAQQVAAL